jgi:hypothetical protein
MWKKNCPVGRLPWVPGKPLIFQGSSKPSKNNWNDGILEKWNIGEKKRNNSSLNIEFLLIPGVVNRLFSADPSLPKFHHSIIPDEANFQNRQKAIAEQETQQ